MRMMIMITEIDLSIYNTVSRVWLELINNKKKTNKNFSKRLIPTFPL